MKKIVYFLIFPVVFVLMRIYLVENVSQLLSYLLFILVNFGINVIFYLGFLGVLKGKVHRNILGFMIVGFVGADQFVKLIVSRCEIECNVIGKLLRIKPTHNLHQAAALNFLNVEMDTLLIIVCKILIVLAIVWIFVKLKNKSSECICAFIFLMSAGIATIIDSICWGYTLDYIFFYKLTCYDLKDFYVDIAIGCILIDVFGTQKMRTNQ